MFFDEVDLDISNEDLKFIDDSIVLELDQIEKKRFLKVSR